jgi:hypothetical protein
MMTIPGTIERLTAPLHDDLKILHDYWRAKKGLAKAPSRALILPEELVPLLPYLALFDVLDRGDFHVRLWGPGLVRAYDGDLASKLVSECDLDAINAQLREQLANVVRECRPNVIRAKFVKDTDDRYLAFERIALPLSADGETVNMILCGYHVERAF